MDILLVAPARKSYSGLAKFPPLGLGYLASALRKKGYEVGILDCMKEGLDGQGFKDHVREKSPFCVGVNYWSAGIDEVKNLLGLVKETDKGIITIVGGPHPSALPDQAMESAGQADYGFKGEAEAGLPMLMDHLSGKGKTDISSIPGLIYKEGLVWRVNQQVYQEDLDSLDYQAWDLIKPQDYSQAGAITSGGVAPIITTRGCPYLCSFCSPHIIAGRKVRRRSIKNVIHEIKLLKADYGIKGVAIMDENFTFYPEHAINFCESVIREKLKMRFALPNGIRLDTLDSALLKLMRKAGFIPSIAVGIESGSERVLKIIRKNLTKDLIRRKVALMRKHGFRPIGYFILGFPFETRAEMYETLQFAKELKLFRAGFSPLLPLPATDIYNDLKNSGKLPAGFDFAALTTDSLVCLPDGMTREEFNNTVKDIILKFNLQPRVILDYMRDFNSFVFASVKFRELFLKRFMPKCH